MVSHRELRGFGAYTGLALAALLPACAGPSSPTELDGETALYALVSTVDGVSLGLPLGPGPVVSGPFDAALLPRLAVVLEGTNTRGEVALSATFDRLTHPTLRLVAVHESYFVDLPASVYFPDPSLAYRVRVLLDGRELARSDLSNRVFEVMATVPNLTVGVKVRIEDRPAPRLDAAAPAELVAGNGDGEVTLTGAGFVRDTVFRVGDTELFTRYLSPTEVRVTVPASLLDAVGPRTITAFTPAPGGGTASVGVDVVAGVAAVTSLSPAAILVGSNAQPLTIDGAGFRVGAEVEIDGALHQVLSLSSTQLAVTVPASVLAVHGDHLVRVVNPRTAPSVALTLEVTYPSPQVASLSPYVVRTGEGARLLVSGRDLTPDSVVSIAGRALETTYVADYQLSVEVPTDLTPGVYAVTVFTPSPGGGTSAPINLTVEAPPPPDFTLQCALSNGGVYLTGAQSYSVGCNVISNRAYTGQVSFSCSTSGGATCTAPVAQTVAAYGFPVVYFWLTPLSPAVAGQYSFHLEATDGAVTRVLDAPFSISASTCGTVPAPALLQPYAGAAQLPNSVTDGASAGVSFAWVGSSEATAYELDIATDPTFRGRTTVSTTTPRYTYTFYEPGLTYYWRVHGYNGCNTGAYSEIRSFTTAGERGRPAINCEAAELNPGVDLALNVGTSGSFSCSVMGVLGWTGTALLDCRNLPAGASCTVDPPAVRIVDPAVSVPVTFTLRTSLTTPTTADYVYPRVYSGNRESQSFVWVAYNPCASLSTPVLTGPADNATNTGFTPALFWNSVTGATSYTVEIASDSAFTDIVRAAAPTTGTYTVAPGLRPGTTYYWRVAANNSCRTTAYSAVRRFTTGNGGTFEVSCTPGAASVVQGGAASASCVYTSRNNFTGTVTPSCLGYATGLSCAFSPSSVVLAANGSASVNVTLSATGTAPVGTSAGYVRGASGAQTGGVRFPATVSAPCVPLTAAPTPANPLDGTQSFPSLTPPIGWSPVANATTYRLELATDPGFSSVLQTVDSPVAATNLTTPLPGATAIYWRVSASNACSTTGFGATSSFTTRPADGVGLACEAVPSGPRDTLLGATCTASALQAFSGDVTLSCSGAAGVSCAVGPGTVTLARGGVASLSLSVRADGTASSGAGSVVVRATSSSGVTELTVPVSVP